MEKCCVPGTKPALNDESKQSLKPPGRDSQDE